METNNEEELKKIVKKVFPQMMALPKDKVCPSEDALAAFAEGKLKGKKEENLISHLAFCNDCLETIKFLREAPSGKEVTVHAWLEKTVQNLFPEKPTFYSEYFDHTLKKPQDVLEKLNLPILASIPVLKKLGNP